MTTINEDYVSYETAQLLKEKRFDEEVLAVYIYDNLFVKGENEIVNPANVPIILAPTLQMAMKWLRQTHNLCIEPYRTACGYLYTISTIPYGSCKCNPKEGGDDEDSGQWTTYEGACEAALKYSLESLI